MKIFAGVYKLLGKNEEVRNKPTEKKEEGKHQDRRTEYKKKKNRVGQATERIIK